MKKKNNIYFLVSILKQMNMLSFITDSKKNMD